MNKIGPVLSGTGFCLWMGIVFWRTVQTISWDITKASCSLGIPSADWKCNTPSKANAFGERHWALVIFQVQPRESIWNFLGVAAGLSPALWSVPLYGLQSWAAPVSVASPSTAVLPSISLLVVVLCWLVLSWTLGQCVEHVEWACREMSHHAGLSSTSGVCRGELALTFVLSVEDLHSQHDCISVWCVEIGIKPVQRTEICWGE